MGRDKALLPYRGVTLAAHIASIVQQAAGSATLVGNPDLYGHLGIPMIADLYPGEGPLGGLITVLKNSQADWNLVLACDLPSLTVPFLESLLADCRGLHRRLPGPRFAGWPARTDVRRLS